MPPRSTAVPRALYRELLRVVTLFDRNPGLRAMISASNLYQPDQEDNGAGSTGSPKNNPRRFDEIYNGYLQQLLNHRQYYIPPKTVEGSREVSMANLLQAEFRRNTEDDGEYNALLDAGFFTLKQLSNILAHARRAGVVRNKSQMESSQGLKPHSSDSEHVTPCLHARLTSSLRPGVFLISHPLLQQPFMRSVILLTEHRSEGSKGFIINRPTQQDAHIPFSMSRPIEKYFGSNKVRYGGPVPMAQFLHTNIEIGGYPLFSEKSLMNAAKNYTITESMKKRIAKLAKRQLRAKDDSEDDHTQIDDGEEEDEPLVFVGGDLQLACRAIRQHKMTAEELVFINGHAGWAPKQLEQEVAEGAWIPVSAPLSLALEEDTDLWTKLLVGLGGEYAHFGCTPSDMHE